MLKCDAQEVSKAFQNYVELYLERDCNWVNTGDSENGRKAQGNSKSNFKKVIEFCMTLLSKDEKAIRNTKQPKDRAERTLWAGKLKELSKGVHKKLMKHLLDKEAEMRTKHNMPQLSTTGAKKNPVSTVGSLAKRISTLRTMDTKSAGTYKTEKKEVDFVFFNLIIVCTTTISIYVYLL